jgi:[acyl-carrier-protein] S-malonyltransferase
MALKRLCFLFPGQGAQYVGMGRSFYNEYPVARQIFEQADDALKMNLSQIIMQGPENTLTETKIAQSAIFVTSYAMLAVLKQLVDLPVPVCTAGLSLGEYTALTAAGIMTFEKALPLVSERGSLMHKACEETKGTMLVILGLSDDQVRLLVDELHMPNDLWCANFNCPGQVVVSGTYKGIEAAEKAAKAAGARRTLPLQVHGAFHSGLMKSAEEKLAAALAEVPMTMSLTRVAMNVTGQFAESESQIRSLLTRQVTSSVLWHSCVKTCESQEVSCFLEIGCGKTLTGLNKRIGVQIPTISIESTEDIQSLEALLT